MENKGRYRRPYATLWIVSGFPVFIGYVLHIVGFATNYWTQYGSLENHGLWRDCADNKDCVDLKFDTVDWFRAVQALTIIGIILGFLALTIISFIICFPRQYVWRIAACTCAVLAGLSVISAIAVYGGKMETSGYLHYSFGLSTAGGGLMLIGGIVLCVDIGINRGYRRQPPKVRNPPQARLYYQSSYPQELRALPYDGYKIPYPILESPRVYEWYPENAYDKKVYEPYRNYGRYDQGPITYVAYDQDYGRKTGRFDYY